MNVSELEIQIKELQQELNRLTSKPGCKLTNQHILKISTKLDDLIVEYLKAIH